MDEPDRLCLPNDSELWSSDFLLGVATSSYQIEGDAMHRQQTIWDTFCERPGAIADASDGRTACDHVNRYRHDLDLLDELNVDAYRLSLSWARVLREDGTLDPRGIDFYQRLLSGLRERGIAPWVTLYHWDLPQHLEDDGGWLNRDMAHRFQDYVDQVTRALPDTVEAWSTLNEPMCSAWLGYGCGVHAPGLEGTERYAIAAHHLLLAHGLGMQVLATNVPEASRGICLNVSCIQPATHDPADRAAARQADDFLYRRFLDPLLEGRYPAALGSSPGALPPECRDDDLSIIHQPLQFLGINYYTRAVYRADGSGGFTEVEPQGELTAMGWEVYPNGLTEMLTTLDRDYELPPVYITENGVAFPDELKEGEVEDPRRIEFIQDHLLAVDQAIRQGVDVRGFFYWSFMDNFEWAEGYSKRFGVVYVDYATQGRTVKASGEAWSRLLSERRARAGGPGLRVGPS